MFEALKRLWNKDSLVTEKPIVVKTNISEPVISFVKAVKKDPKRFEISKSGGLSFGVFNYSISDKKTLGNFSCKIYFRDSVYTGSGQYVFGKSEPWLTDEEVLYVVKELEDFFKEKVERVKSKIEKRARERLIKLYKGE